MRGVIGILKRYDILEIRKILRNGEKFCLDILY